LSYVLLLHYLAVLVHVVNVLVHRLDVDPLSVALPVADVVVSKENNVASLKGLAQQIVEAQVLGEAVAHEDERQRGLVRVGQGPVS
jgi:hypothetical protein